MKIGLGAFVRYCNERDLGCCPQRSNQSLSWAVPMMELMPVGYRHSKYSRKCMQIHQSLQAFILENLVDRSGVYVPREWILEPNNGPR